ncbi:hypothetical protein HY620_01970 [Candidatus Uhrbacteria bacterium]|nr:hypothetical protein [Candidatus Uhrbacteria bacterium]
MTEQSYRIGCKIFKASRTDALQHKAHNVVTEGGLAIQSKYIFEESSADALSLRIATVVNELFGLSGNLLFGFGIEPVLFRIPIKTALTVQTKSSFECVSLHVHNTRSAELQKYLLTRWQTKDLSAIPRESTIVQGAIAINLVRNGQIFTDLELTQLIIDVFNIHTTDQERRANLMIVSKRRPRHEKVAPIGIV